MGASVSLDWCPVVIIAALHSAFLCGPETLTVSSHPVENLHGKGLFSSNPWQQFIWTHPEPVILTVYTYVKPFRLWHCAAHTAGLLRWTSTWPWGKSMLHSLRHWVAIPTPPPKNKTRNLSIRIVNTIPKLSRTCAILLKGYQNMPEIFGWNSSRNQSWLNTVCCKGIIHSGIKGACLRVQDSFGLARFGQLTLKQGQAWKLNELDVQKPVKSKPMGQIDSSREG